MNKKAVVSTLGVVVLGALGSGLWELAKPLLGWAWSALITVSTLGLDSLRDGMYAQAGSFLGRSVGLAVAIPLLIAMICALLALTMQTLVMAGTVRRHPSVTLYQLTLMVISITMFVSGVRAAYVTQLSRYYEMLEVIAGPYVSDAELKEQRAALARAHSRDEFIRVIQTLSSRVRSAGKTVPDQSFF